MPPLHPLKHATVLLWWWLPDHVFASFMGGLLRMIIAKVRLLIHLSLCGPILAAAPGMAATMGMQEVLQYALLHAPGLTQSQEQLRIRGWQQDQAKAKFLPSLDVTTSQGLQKSVAPPWAARRDAFDLGAAPSANSPLFGTLGLSLSETFYDNGQSQAQLDISSADRDVAALTAQRARDEALLNAMKSYYALSQAHILLETNKQQHELLDKQLRLLGTMYRQGLKTKREYLRLESEVRRAAVDVRAAAARVDGAEVDLRRAIGAPPTDRSVMFSIVPAEVVLKNTLAFPSSVPGVERSYEARIAAFDAAAAAQRVELARRKNLPQLTISSGVNYQNPDYLGLHGRPQAQDLLAWNVTVGLNYNLWDDGSRRHDIDIAASQQLIQSEDTKDKLAALAADIETLMQSLSNLSDIWRLNLQLITLEQENLKNIEQDYREGKVVYLDLITGLTALLNAKVNFFSTYFAAQQALAQYHFYEGTIADAVARF